LRGWIGIITLATELFPSRTRMNGTTLNGNGHLKVVRVGTRKSQVFERILCQLIVISDA